MISQCYFQNFEYMFQVIGDASWSGLVHAINQKLNFEIVGLNLDPVYVMNTLVGLGFILISVR